MNYIGIDYGKSHVGLAMAFGPLAQPWGETTPEKLIAKVWELKTSFGIEAIIMGLPEGSMKIPVEEMAQKLRLEGFLVFLTDETLTTYDAQKAVRHKSKHKRTKSEHRAAAAIILQSWLDKQ